MACSFPFKKLFKILVVRHQQPVKPHHVPTCMDFRRNTACTYGVLSCQHATVKRPDNRAKVNTQKNTVNLLHNQEHHDHPPKKNMQTHLFTQKYSEKVPCAGRWPYSIAIFLPVSGNRHTHCRSNEQHPLRFMEKSPFLLLFELFSSSYIDRVLVRSMPPTGAV
jgi:hypothetical protein